MNEEIEELYNIKSRKIFNHVLFFHCRHTSEFNVISFLINTAGIPIPTRMKWNESGWFTSFLYNTSQRVFFSPFQNFTKTG